MRLRYFNSKTIEAYLYYSKELLIFLLKYSDKINKQDFESLIVFCKKSNNKKIYFI